MYSSSIIPTPSASPFHFVIFPLDRILMVITALSKSLDDDPSLTDLEFGTVFGQATARNPIVSLRIFSLSSCQFRARDAP